jgi:SAM-dependent methyltransferase
LLVSALSATMPAVEERAEATTPVVDHYKDQYWNDLPTVVSHLCRRATGDPGLWWMDYFKARYATPPRKRALVFGCGNGWVERDLYDRSVAEQFDAFDASAAYLEQATRARLDRRITYAQADFDSYRPASTYDLLVNVASLHHVRYLFRMLAILRDALEDDGVFVHWEYVGPSRNQYTDEHLAVMRGINEALPRRFRTPHPLRHDLRTFLAGDPTEAVHAADIPRALDLFFEPVERKLLGGGVAYQILWNNLDEFRKGDAEAKGTLDWLLTLDERLTESGAVPPLFAFLVYRKRQSTGYRALLGRFVEEPVREAFARAAGGRYPAEVLRGGRERARALLDRAR